MLLFRLGAHHSVGVDGGRFAGALMMVSQNNFPCLNFCFKMCHYLRLLSFCHQQFPIRLVPLTAGLCRQQVRETAPSWALDEAASLVVAGAVVGRVYWRNSMFSGRHITGKSYYCVILVVLLCSGIVIQLLFASITSSCIIIIVPVTIFLEYHPVDCYLCAKLLVQELFQ